MEEERSAVGGITFGNWKLVPLDDRNWELCHLHASSRGKNEGVEQWHRLGRYYGYHGIDLAMLYAADVELKWKHRETARDIIEALHEWRDILDGFRADVRGLLAPDDA